MSTDTQLCTASPKLGPVACCVMIVADLKVASTAYTDNLYQTAGTLFCLDDLSAQSVGYPQLAGHSAVAFANQRGRQWLLMIETKTAEPRDALRSHGWMAQELLVENVDELAKDLEDSPFTILRPPADLDISDRIRACQVRGPAGEILYLTEVKGSVPPFELPQCEAPVDHLFIAVLSTPDRDASLDQYAQIAGNEGLRFDTCITVVNQALGLPLEQRHPVGTLQLADKALIEIDHIAQAEPLQGDVCLGTAAMVFWAAGQAPATAIRPDCGPFSALALCSYQGVAGERFTLAYRH